MEVLCALRQAVVETYTALAVDPSFVIAIVQAVLQLLNLLVKHIKEEPPLSRSKLGRFLL